MQTKDVIKVCVWFFDSRDCCVKPKLFRDAFGEHVKTAERVRHGFGMLSESLLEYIDRLLDIIRRASHVTPTPGGVGPMTVAMLIKNTLTVAQNR